MTTSATTPSPARDFQLDRRRAVPALIGTCTDFLMIGGVGGPSNDIIATTSDGDNIFTLAGAMGAACSMGLGLALAQPARRVLVVTGDGELLMSLGSLGTIGLVHPENLSLVCIDNGCYGETGNQESATRRVVDLEGVARAAGIERTATVQCQDDIAAASALLRQPGPVFVLLRVNDGDPSRVERKNLNGIISRLRFKTALHSHDA